ncbi:MAG: universal stress protein [Vicinamibacterales bacterium]
MIPTTLAYTATGLLLAPRRPRPAAAAPAPGRRVLFATDLADPPPAAMAMLRHLARTGPLVVDVVHVAASAGAAAEAEPRMRGMLADVYDVPVRRRIVVDADVAAAIRRVSAEAEYHLVMAPAAPATHLWRRSRRTALVGTGDVPLWTMGDAASADRATVIRRLACEVTLEARGDRHLPFARQLAARLGARLIVVHVVPPIDDGTIADGLTATRPLHPEVARAQLQQLMGDDPVEIAIGTGPRASTLRQLLEATRADLLCAPAGDAAGPWRLAAHLRRAPCPVVIAGPHAHRAWTSDYALGTSLRMRPFGLSVSR